MKAAARTLTPLTLELGGKSPTVIAEDFSIEVAAKRIIYAKLLNAGQTCVAPDYVFIPRRKMSEFVSAAETVASNLYPSAQSKDYTSIIDQGAFDRLQRLLIEAQTNGSEVVNLLGKDPIDETQRKIPPHLILDPADESLLMRDEIFGPILPVIPYDDVNDTINHINSKDRPLALYLYSKNRSLQKRFTYETMSGGICINDSLMHVAQQDTPFGGIGSSGMGQYHGHEGFLEFSKMRPIFKQGLISSGSEFLSAPYGKQYEFMMSALLKFKL